MHKNLVSLAAFNAIYCSRIQISTPTDLHLFLVCAYTRRLYAVSRRGISPVIFWRGPSASPLRFVIIACRPTHPSFNHRRSSFSEMSLLPDCGTLCRWASRRRRHWLFSGNVWRHISSVILSPNLQ